MTVTAGPPDTRDSILMAAEMAFGTAGYRSTTMATVASAAGVSRPLVHRYFGDKETLYTETVERLLRDWHLALEHAAARPTPTTGHRLRAVISECGSWARERPMLRGLLLLDADLTRRVAKGTLDEGRRRLPALLETVLDEGVERGDVRGDLSTPETASVLADSIIAGALRAITAPDEARHRAWEHTMTEVLLHGVVA